VFCTWDCAPMHPDTSTGHGYPHHGQHLRRRPEERRRGSRCPPRPDPVRAGEAGPPPSGLIAPKLLPKCSGAAHGRK
jgi:hypothetical protein